VFNQDRKYWSFLRAIKRAYRGVNKHVILDCLWIRHNSVAPSAEKGSFWSSLGGGGGKPAADAVELTVEVSDGIIWFSPASGRDRDRDQVPPETPVGDVIAVSLASDYCRVRSLSMEVSFLSHTWDPAVMGGGAGSGLCVQVHHSGRPSEVPTTFSDLGNRQFIYLTDADLLPGCEDRVVLKVMTDNPNQSVERLELGKYELKLNALQSLLKGAQESEQDEPQTGRVTSPGGVDAFLDPAFQEVRTLPSLTPFHPALPPVPLVEHVILSVPDTRRMYKLVLHSALDVLGGEDDPQAYALLHKMNCYAVVELFNAQGELLCPANFHKTNVCSSSLDPVWETEFNFPLQINGKDIDSIVVRVRDASGYLRHKTIGRVSIPTSVFVSVSEMALLRLPIESIDFATGESISDFNGAGFDMFGMISLGTQTCPRDDALVDKMYGGFVDTASSSSSSSSSSKAGAKAPAGAPAAGPTPGMLLEAAEQGYRQEGGGRRIVRQMSAAGQAVVSFCVRELSVCETCWPYDTLSTVALEITAGGAARRNSASAATPPGAVMAVSFGSGHLFAGSDHLVVLPGQSFDNSLMRWCAELDPKCSLLEPVLRLPWGQVKEIDAITDTSLILTVILHRTSTEHKVASGMEEGAGGGGGANQGGAASQTSGKFRANANSNAGSTDSPRHGQGQGRTNTGAFEADILIAPCPAGDLARMVHERVQLEAVRGNVKSFLKQCSAAATAAAGAGAAPAAMSHRRNNGHPPTPAPKPAPASPAALAEAANTLSLAKSVFQVIERTFVAVIDAGSASSNSGVVLNGSSSSIVCSPMEFSGNYSPADFLNSNGCNGNNNSSNSGSSKNANNAYHASAYCPPYGTKQSIELRLRLLITLLMEVCSTVRPHLPGYDPTSTPFGSSSSTTAERVAALLRLDDASATEALVNLDDSCADKTTKKMEFLTEGSLNTLREAVLCGWDSSYPSNVVSFADTLVVQTMKILKETLNLRLSDLAAFDVLEGFANKTALVKYVLENNNYFYSAARTIVGVGGLTSAHLPKLAQDSSGGSGGSNASDTATPADMLLLNTQEMADVVSIFSTTVVNETKAWLAKTLTHYLTTKTNQFGLPWDVDSVGSLCVSPIPETLRFQLNAYMSVCRGGDGDDLGSGKHRTVTCHAMLCYGIY
jgi:hypothetical protein